MRWVRTELKEADVIEAFRQNPHETTRELALRENIPSRSSILRILEEAKFHPYKMQHRQEISEANRLARVEHATSQLGIFDVSGRFLDNVLFSDECHFHIHGGINHQNFRYWSDQNPHWYHEEPLHSPRITVWAAVGRRGVIGAIFFDGNVNGESHLRMLQNEFLPRVRGVRNLVLMQNGAPLHWAIAVRRWLDEQFPLRWMGRGTQVEPAPFRWPPNLPDLTPCDFFLWGYLKSRIYRTQPADLNELRARIVHEYEVLPGEMVLRSIDSYVRRLERCVEVEGRSVEQSYADVRN